MATVRLAYGRLDAGGAGVLPAQLEGIDYLLLNGGAVAPPGDTAVLDILLDTIDLIAPHFFLDPNFRVIASLGGSDPREAAKRVAQRLEVSFDLSLSIAAVRGQDVLARLEELLQESALPDLLTGESFLDQQSPTVAAIATMGHEPTLAALAEGAQVVLVSHEDPSELAVAAAADAFGPDWLVGGLKDHANGLGHILESINSHALAVAPAGSNLGTTIGVTAELSDQGEVFFFGDSDLCSAAQQDHLEEMDRQAGPWLWLVLHTGWSLTAVVSTEQDRDLERCIEMLASIGLTEVIANTGVRSAFLRREYETLGEAEQALKSTCQILGALQHSCSNFASELGPSLLKRHYAWLSKCPPIDLEWAIDTRPAREWID